MSLADVVEAIAERADEWGVRTVFGDQREEAGLRSLFAEHEIGFQSFAWTEPSKDDAVMWIRRVMRESLLCLSEHERFRRELVGMKARLMPSGRTKYETNGLDYASALVTLAHAALTGDVLVGDLGIAAAELATRGATEITSATPGFWGNQGEGFG
jgi:hypothetical protein